MRQINSYEEFKKIIPKETVKFIDELLPILLYVTNDSNPIYIGDNNPENIHTKTLIAVLDLFFHETEEYSSFFKMQRYNSFLSNMDELKEDVKQRRIPKSFLDASLDEIFQKFKDLFFCFDEENYYQTLTPLKILLNAYQNLINNFSINSSSITRLFKDSYDATKCYEGLKDFRKKEYQNISSDISRSFFGDLPIVTIHYLESVAIIHNILSRVMGTYDRYNKNILTNDTEDIMALSRLLAIFYYKDVATKDSSNSISTQESLVALMEKNGIKLDAIYRLLNLDINKTTFLQENFDVFNLQNRYKKYIFEGKNQNKKEEDISVLDIINNLWDRKFNDSLLIEKILSHFNCCVEMFEDLDKKLEQSLEEQKKTRVLNSMNDFYKDLPNETRNFITFTAKTYTYLINQMKEQHHNKDVLVSEDDADTLALFIAIHYFDCDVNKFFNGYKVTLDKVLKYLKLDISKEKILETELDEQILVNKYKHFVYDGYNKNETAKNIQINDIARNLCSRSFNKSMIIEVIFDHFCDEIDLNSDFLKQLENYLSETEKNRKRELSQKIFKNLPVETIEYIENVSRIHQFLLTKPTDLSKEDIRTLSSLLGLKFAHGDVTYQFFYSLGFKPEEIKNFFELGNLSESNMLGKAVDIDLISNEYGEFIFGGHNRGLQKKDLTVHQMASNIFNTELNDSILMTKFLDSKNLDYSFFEHFEENYQKYKKELQIKKLNEQKENLLSRYSDGAKEYINIVSIIHQSIFNQFMQGTTNKKLIKNDKDIEELSMLLGIFFVPNNSVQFFHNKNLSLQNICSYCQIILPDKETIEDGLVHDDVIVASYPNYLTYNSSKYNQSTDDLIHTLFIDKINSSQIIETLSTQFGSVYEFLKTEVETGKQFIPPLTKEEHLEKMLNNPIPTLDFNDSVSVVNFGNALSEDAKMIHEYLNELAVSDHHSVAIKQINEIIDTMYPVAQITQKKSFFHNLFLKDENTEQSPTLIIDDDRLVQLNQAINNSIEKLADDLNKHDFIRKYIEFYRRKNRAYLKVAEDAKEKLVDDLNPSENEDDVVNYFIQTKLQIANDKINRFATSNLLMKQELLKIYQGIANHIITINALQMARDNFMPLIGSELCLIHAKNTENDALKLSGNVIKLFQALLTRNMAATSENIEFLKTSSLDTQLYQQINQSIQEYLILFNKTANSPITLEAFDIDDETPDDRNPNKLSLKP